MVAILFRPQPVKEASDSSIFDAGWIYAVESHRLNIYLMNVSSGVQNISALTH